MLADVEVDWNLPDGYGIRAMHQIDGQTDDVLVCIPLPGHKRYRISMLVPEELRTTPRRPVSSPTAWRGKAPEPHHIQAVLDRLAPERTVAANIRWSVDAEGNLATAYGFTADDSPIDAVAGCVIRPDGYLGYRTSKVDLDRLFDWLGGTLAG